MNKLYPNGVLQDEISEYFHLYELYQTMIIGSVEDERVFSSLQFVKSKVRNILVKKLENCFRLYVSLYNVDMFPYDRAIAIWN